MRNKNSHYVGAASELGIESNAVCRFYAQNWQRPISLSIPTFYRWQFCDPPENNSRDMCCVAVDGGDNIIGVMGLNKRSFYLNGQLCKAAELTTWVVSEKARGRGVGRSIMNYLQNAYDVLMGMGITMDALPIYTTNGFRFMRYIPRFFRIYDLASVRPFAKIEQLGERLVQDWLDKPVKKHKAEEVAVESLEDLAIVLVNGYNHYLRDAAYFNWRYNQHPVFKYRAFRIGSAAVILRLDEVQGLRIVHITDTFGKPSDMDAAVAFIDSFCLENDVHASDFYCPAPTVSRYFMAGGWFSVLDDYYFQLTHLFYPSEVRIPPTTSLSYWAREDMLDLLNTAKLYVTKSDLDLDRPTLPYYDVHKISYT